MGTLSDCIVPEDLYTKGEILCVPQVKAVINKTLRELTSTAVETKKGIADIFKQNFGDALLGAGE